MLKLGIFNGPRGGLGVAQIWRRAPKAGTKVQIQQGWRLEKEILGILKNDFGYLHIFFWVSTGEPQEKLGSFK